MNAVKEANRLNIPVIAMVDTCCDPTPIDYVIPANDDAAKSISLIMDIVCGAIAEGLNERKLEKEKEVPAEQSEEKASAGKKLRARKTAVKAESEEAAPAVEAEAAAPAAEESAAPAVAEEAPATEAKAE